MRFLWLGTYEADYPRGRVLRAGLRELGHEVVECHIPLWERTRHKAGGFLAPASLAKSGLAAARAWVTLARRERRIGVVDAVVVGYPAQPDAPLGRWVARRRRAPLVADMMIALGDTLAGDRGRAGAVAGAGLGALDRFCARSADVVMTDTRTHAEWMRHRFGLPAGRVVPVPVGAEPDAFPPTPEPPGPARALFVGKLAPLHGLPTVLEAVRMSDTPPVTVVGDGQLMPWLRSELARDTPAGLTHIPWIPYDDLGAALARHHIALGVFGTSEKAGRVIPNKVWQALAAARPVITADTPGARELLRDGENALLVPSGDAVALAAAMTRLASDAALRHRLGHAGRETYERAGTPAAVAGRFVAALEAAA